MRNGGAGTAGKRGGQPAGRWRRVAPMLVGVAVNALVLGAAGALVVSAGPAAAATAAAPGTVFIADTFNNRVVEAPPGGGTQPRWAPA